MLLRSEAWKALSAAAKILYLYVKCKYNGSNNGEIVLNYSELRGVRGVCSPSTISKAFRELERSGWITRTQVGGLYRFQNKYSLTGTHDEYIR